MITNNFKQFMKTVLAARSSAPGLLEVTNVSGAKRYAGGYFYSSFPYSLNVGFTTGATYGGISVGSGSRAAEATDYQLQTTITSGLSGSIVTNSFLDDDGNVAIQYDITLTNTSSSEITIREIGYKQQFYTSSTQNSTTGSTTGIFLIDRTVLDAPVIIPAGGYGVVRYTLKTVA